MRLAGAFLVITGVGLVAWALAEAPGTLLEVLSRGAEPSANRYENDLIRLIGQLVVGVAVMVVGVRTSRRKLD